MKLDLNDLQPQEATFELSEHKGVTFTLKKFSLSARIWMNNRFKQEEIKKFFSDQSMEEISEVVFYLLKDKSILKTLEDLRDAVTTKKDMANIFQALLTTIGLSEPVMEKLAKDADLGNAPSPSQPTGAQSTT